MNYDGWYLKQIKVEVDVSAVMKNEPQIAIQNDGFKMATMVNMLLLKRNINRAYVICAMQRRWTHKREEQMRASVFMSHI